MKNALIIGITGQDGSYLAELLLEKKYNVFGLIRRSSSMNTSRIEHIYKNIQLFYGDLTDIGSIMNAITSSIGNSDNLELYNLGAMSHVKVSFDIEKYSADVNAIGTLNVLQAIKLLKLEKQVKVYQASTSEMYGNSLVQNNLQYLNEDSPMNPVSPYAIAKLYAYHLTKYYRDAYKMFCVNGILQNHTSPRRGHNFVCKKICDYVKKYKSEKIEPLQLGNLNSTRDFGHSKDYVYAMWLMLNSNSPKDYVVSTGRRTSVKEFVEMAFKIGLNYDIIWEGEGLDEKGYIKRIQDPFKFDDHKELVVEVNPKYFRPYELTDLVGDSTKIKQELGWEPKYKL